MIQNQTILNVSDNSGAKKVICIKVLGGSKKRYANSGELIVCSVLETSSHSKIKKGSVVKAVIVRTLKEKKRQNGMYVRFSDNGVVLIGKNNNPLGTRIFGYISKLVKKNSYPKIISLSSETI